MLLNLSHEFSALERAHIVRGESEPLSAFSRGSKSTMSVRFNPARIVSLDHMNRRSLLWKLNRKLALSPTSLLAQFAFDNLVNFIEPRVGIGAELLNFFQERGSKFLIFELAQVNPDIQCCAANAGTHSQDSNAHI
jgi:hypothetical protein